MLGSSRTGAVGYEECRDRCMASHWHSTSPAQILPSSTTPPVLSLGKTQAHANVLLGRWTHWQLQWELSHCHAPLVFFGIGSFRVPSEECYVAEHKTPNKHFNISILSYFPKMKWETHSRKDESLPHNGWRRWLQRHPSLRYHRRATSKTLFLKVLDTQHQEPLHPDWFDLEAWGI